MQVFGNQEDLTYSDADIKRMRVRLAQEAEIMSNVINIFRNILPALGSKIHEIKSVFHGVKADVVKTDFKAISGFFFNKKYTDRLTNANFFQLAELPIQVPEAFTGNLVEYGELLNQLSAYYYKMIPEQLSVYRTYLAAFISDKSTKVALKDHTSFYKKAEAELGDSTKKLGVFISNKYQTKSVAYLGKVVKRLEELDEIKKLLHVTEGIMDIKHIRLIETELNKTVELLDILINQIKEDSVKDVSGAAATNLAEGAATMAAIVEFSSVLRYRQEVYVNCIKQLLIELDKQL